MIQFGDPGAVDDSRSSNSRFGGQIIIHGGSESQSWEKLQSRPCRKQLSLFQIILTSSTTRNNFNFKTSLEGLSSKMDSSGTFKKNLEFETSCSLQKRVSYYYIRERSVIAPLRRTLGYLL